VKHAADNNKLVCEV